MKNKRFSKVAILIILIYTAILFSNSLNNKFVDWDDNKYITENPFIKDFSFHGVKNIFSNAYFSNYHPFTTLTWLIEYKLFGLNPKPYHLINLLLHLVNIFLVFYIIKILFKNEKLALLIALFFGIHPMHVESVVWISERKDMLYALFFLGSIILYIKYLDKEKNLKYYIFSLLLFIASLLSKSMAVTLPVVLLLIDYFKERKIYGKVILEKVPFLLFSLIIGIIAVKTQTAEGVNTYMPIYSLLDRIFLVSYAVVFYIFKLLFPFELSALHPYPDKINGFLPILYYLSAFIIVPIAWIIYKFRQINKELFFGSLFYLTTISVVIQILPVGQAIVAERYSYIPYLGLFIIIGIIYKKYFEKINRIKSLVIILLILFICFFTFQTFNREGKWGNTKTLYTNILKTNPKYFYGYFLMGNYENLQKNFDVAKTYYESSIKLNSNSKLVYNNLGYIYYIKKDYAEAIVNFNKSIAIDQKYVDPYINRGNVYNAIADYKSAIHDYNIAITLIADNWQPYFNRAIAKANLGDNNGAIDDYNKVIELDTTIVQAYINKAKIYFNMQNFPKALCDLNKAFALDKNNYEIYFNRANVYYYMSNFSDAIKDYNETINLQPSLNVAYFNRGVSKLSLNSKNEACDDFKKALELGYSDAKEMFMVNCK